MSEKIQFPCRGGKRLQSLPRCLLHFFRVGQGASPQHISNFILHDFYFKTFSRPRFSHPFQRARQILARNIPPRNTI